MSSINCSSCGAALEIKNRFSKILVCEYCGTHHRIKDGGINIIGKFAKLADFDSLLKPGTVGTILGTPFTAMGRVRYNYGSGFFDEWFIDLDGDKAWLTDGEGVYTLYNDLYEAVDISEIDQVKAGQNIMVGEKKVMIKEKGKAVVEGAEGELYFYVEPGSEIIYLDAVSEGRKIAIEFAENEVEVFSGRPLLKRDIVVN